MGGLTGLANNDGEGGRHCAGLHPMQLRTLDLDASAAQLGIQTGTIYSLDLFHAERHTGSSTFRIDTNLSFVDCGTVLPPKIK